MPSRYRPPPSVRRDIASIVEDVVVDNAATVSSLLDEYDHLCGALDKLVGVRFGYREGPVRDACFRELMNYVGGQMFQLHEPGDVEP